MNKQTYLGRELKSNYPDNHLIDDVTDAMPGQSLLRFIVPKRDVSTLVTTPRRRHRHAKPLS